MHKAELDRLLEKTVADALGVAMPMHRRARPSAPRQHAKLSRRHSHVREQRGARELHPA